MSKLPAYLLLAGIAAPAAALAQAPAAPAAPEPTPIHTFATKISVWSEYEYRGITQTDNFPALQLNLDYTHASGFYAGLFLTNVSWLKTTAETLGGHTRGGTELDLFGGYRREIAPDTTIDVGYLRYQYPRSDDFFLSPKVHTDEVYGGITWKWLNVKYSYAFSDLFGIANSEGSSFIEGNINYPCPWNDKVTLTVHVGHQYVENTKQLGYSVYKVGAVYDAGDGWNVGGYYKETDAQEDLYTYKNKYWGKGRGVFYVAKTF